MIDATKLIQKQQFEPALVALLGVWRKTREPRVANLIDLVSAHAASKEPIPGESVAEREEAWRKIAKKKKPTDVPRLLAALWPKTRWRAGRELLNLLVEFPDDPRIATALVHALTDRPYPGGKPSPFYRIIYRHLGVLGDRRGVPALKKLEYVADAITLIEGRKLGAVDADALAKAEALLAADAARASADVAEVDALLAAIYEAPDDDAPRAVYADWLSERGDERGEFITLQLARGSGEPTVRERALFKEHRRKWVGRIGERFQMASWIFDRGFFAGGTLHTAFPEDELGADPAVQLVHHLDWSDFGAEYVRTVLALFPSLRSLSTNAVTAAAIAKRKKPWRITKLEVNCSADESDNAAKEAAALARCQALPELRELVVLGYSEAEVGWLADAPVVDRLERLEIRGPGLLRSLAIAIMQRKSTLRELVMHDDMSWRMKLTRTKKGAPWTCAFEPSEGIVMVNELELAIEATPEHVKTLAIDAAIDVKERASIDRALARFAKAGVEIRWQ